jgi:hypothetical protein
MAVTYDWGVETIEMYDEYNGLENVVYRVVWKCIATSDTGVVKDQIGVVDLDLPTTSTGYVSIAELPRTQIVYWVKSKVAVSVVEQSLVPHSKTVSFMENTSTTVTVAEQIAVNQATQSDVTPTPSEG